MDTDIYKLFFDSYIMPILQVIIGAFIGTATGAFAAFALERKHKRLEKLNDEFMAGSEAQIILINQLDTLQDIYRRLNEYKDDEKRHLKIKPKILNPSYPNIPINKLSFMSIGEGADILYNLVNLEIRFHSVIESIRERKKLHLRYQEELPQKNPMTVALLETLTNQIFENIEETISSNENLLRRLTDYLKVTFKKTPLRFDPKESDNKS